MVPENPSSPIHRFFKSLAVCRGENSAVGRGGR